MVKRGTQQACPALAVSLQLEFDPKFAKTAARPRDGAQRHQAKIDQLVAYLT
jgi:hypothetical protein